MNLICKNCIEFLSVYVQTLAPRIFARRCAHFGFVRGCRSVARLLDRDWQHSPCSSCIPFVFHMLPAILAHTRIYTDALPERQIQIFVQYIILLYLALGQGWEGGKDDELRGANPGVAVVLMSLRKAALGRIRKEIHRPNARARGKLVYTRAEIMGNHSVHWPVACSGSMLLAGLS